jgi:hypothetical protein
MKGWVADMKREIKTGKKYQAGFESIVTAVVGSLVSSVVSSIFSPKPSAPRQQSVYSPLPTPAPAPPAAQPVVEQPVVPVSNADDLAYAQQNKMLRQFSAYTSSQDTKSMSKKNRVNTLLGGGLATNVLP